jgi:hypothetical protein
MRKSSGGATKAGIGKADLSCPLTMGVFFIFCFLLSKLKADPQAFSAPLHGQLRSISADLYLTPESRTKLKLEVRDPADDILRKYGL